MKSVYIDIVGKWGVVFCYDITTGNDKEMRAMMLSFGMRDGKIDESLNILLGERNTGMCVSSSGLRMSLIFIGSYTSEDQYWDTVVHELAHCAHAICDYYNVPHDGEDFSWTLGYLTRKVVQKTAPPCI